MTHKPHKRLALALLCLLGLSVIAPSVSQVATVPVPETAVGNLVSPNDRGAAGLGQAIRRLGVVASVLHTGAHPDDEDSDLLAYLARGRQARTAYLALTRGDGGQNLIGPELYELLGVIRTDELLSARRIDGAAQFFSRAFDFGFSKSREETLSKWDREAVLSDMVRVIRIFRPLVIASQFSGTSNDGHGHHQAAGFLTPEAYRAAADPSRFPEHIAEGLRPWKAKKLYVSAPSRGQAQPAAATPAATPGRFLTINTGQFDPLLGRSYYEVAMEGRSQHRSQDQGALQRRGPQFTRLRLVEGGIAGAGAETDIFEGIDVSVMGIAEFAGARGGALKNGLAEIQKYADEAKQTYNPFSTATLTPIIARGLKAVRAMRSSLATHGLSTDEQYEVDFLLKEKERDFEAALLQSEGVVVDCLAEDEVVTPGQVFNLSVFTYSNEGGKLISISLPEGWDYEKKKNTSSVTDGRIATQTDYQVTVPNSADFTQPYWLRNPRNKDMFLPGKGSTGIEPHAPPSFVASVEVEISGLNVVVSQPAQYRFADKALGEIRHYLKVAPTMSVNVTPDLLIFPTNGVGDRQEILVSLTNNNKSPVRGTLKAAGDPPEQPFELQRRGERILAKLTVSRPATSGSSTVGVAPALRAATGYRVISYPHTEPRFVYLTPTVRMQVIDVKVAPGLKVGYIEGAGDDFANALKRLGVNVKVIDSGELASGNLAGYDAIVTGIRVYEVRPDVVANNGRLLDYAKNGGVLIVQYNKNEIAELNLTPYPAKMKRSPDRVTDERAAVTLIEPSHPLFNSPNKITDRDFEGWVQERGAYFFSEWDPRFKPLMACHDVGEEDRKGGALIAEYGKGHYIYTAYGWYRQLPVGVPGAYRLIANLISFSKTRTSPARRVR